MYIYIYIYIYIWKYVYVYNIDDEVGLLKMVSLTMRGGKKSILYINTDQPVKHK
jgi:hypothetical protein